MTLARPVPSGTVNGQPEPGGYLWRGRPALAAQNAAISAARPRGKVVGDREWEWGHGFSPAMKSESARRWRAGKAAAEPIDWARP